MSESERTSVRVRHVRYHADEYLAGVDHAELTIEEQGAYWRICSRIYSANAPLTDDDGKRARDLRVSTRRWRKIRERLIATGKIIVQDGMIRQPRCEFELQSARIRSEKSAESGSKGGKQRAENYKAAPKPQLKQPSSPSGASSNASSVAQANQEPGISLSKDNGKEPPSKEEPESLQATIFGSCLRYLRRCGVKENNARPLLGKWRKEAGDGAVLEIIADVERRGVSEPVPYIEKVIAGRKSKLLRGATQPADIGLSDDGFISRPSA